MQPQFDELAHVALVVGITVATVGALILVGFFGWRGYQAHRHARISKKRRYEATQIDLFHRSERPQSSGGRHRRRGRSHSGNHMIDLCRPAEGAAEGGGQSRAD